MLSITPIWLITGTSQTIPVHLALTLGALFDLVTIAGIWTLAFGLTQRAKIAGFVVLIYAWNPYNLAASINGLETSVGAMLFVWSLVLYWRLRMSAKMRWHDWMFMGGIWAILLLARTDYLVIIAPCAIDLVWRQRRNLHYVWVAGFGAVLWLPWLAWNLATFNSFSQVSGQAYPYYLRTLWQAEGHTTYQWLVQETRMAYGILANLSRFSGFDKLIVVLAFASGALMIGTYARRNDSFDSNFADWSRLAGLLWPTLGAISLLMLHGLMRWMYIPWYFVPLSILITLWFGVFLGWLDLKRPALATAVGVVVVILQVGQGAAVVHSGGMWAEQARKTLGGVPRMTARCEQYEIVGITDAGFPGYFLPCRVINLDGVVNNQAFNAIKQGTFRSYLDETGIEYAHINNIVSSVVELKEGPVPLTPPFSDSK